MDMRYFSRPENILRAYFYREVTEMDWNLLKENLNFVIVCIVIVTGLALAAKLVERFLPERRKVTPARRITIIGICAAIATVLHMLDFPLLFLAPGFYKLDFPYIV